MAANLHLITGATGLLGSHVAEQLVQRGEKVRALVRPSSAVQFLHELGVETVAGDLGDVASLRQAMSGAAVVYHCAARVGDWSPWQQFQREVIDATRNVLDACRQEQVQRVLYVSSIQVYGHPVYQGQPFTEDEPLGQNVRSWEFYARSKIAAEQHCQSYPGALTIVRPSWIYGPRDRNTLPRLLKTVKSRRVGLIDSGEKPLNIIHAADVARGVILAASSDRAVGRAYNLSGAGDISQKEMLDLVAQALQVPPIRRNYSLRTAYLLGLFSEAIGKAIFLRRAPYCTRYGIGLIERTTHYSCARAKEELGWQPEIPSREGLQQAIAWQLQREPNLLPV
jgi:nucleoside-diphosphate-sugar epimerase